MGGHKDAEQFVQSRETSNEPIKKETFQRKLMSNTDRQLFSLWRTSIRDFEA